MLSDEELDRYARHLVLREVGGTGQARIRAAKVLMVGAGAFVAVWEEVHPRPAFTQEPCYGPKGATKP